MKVLAKQRSVNDVKWVCPKCKAVTFQPPIVKSGVTHPCGALGHAQPMKREAQG